MIARVFGDAVIVVSGAFLAWDYTRSDTPKADRLVALAAVVLAVLFLGLLVMEIVG